MSERSGSLKATELTLTAKLWRHGFQSVWGVGRGVPRVYIHAVEPLGVRGTGFICEYMDLIRAVPTGKPCLL